MTSVLIMCIVAIVLVVVLGAKTKSNIGLWAMAAAYILGAFILKMKVSDIINMWPTKIFILLFSVTFFYGFAILNKTLEKVSMQVVYRFRKTPWAIPFILYVLGFVIAGIGAGDAANAMLIPIAMSIAAVAGMHPFLGGISVLAGVGTGGFSPISVIGIFIRGLMEQVGKYPPEEANVYANHALLHAFVLFMIILLVAYFVFKGYKIKSPVMDKPEPLDKKQKITLWIIAGFVVLLLVPPILKTIFPASKAIKFINGNINVAFIAFIASIVAILTKVGDQKAAFARVPWATLTVLAGMGMLVSIMTASGAIKVLSDFMSNNVSAVAAPILLALFAGFLSIFVSGFVVNMTFFSLVPGLAVGLGLNPGILFAAVCVGALATSVSPFSGSGGLVIASIDDEKIRDKMFKMLLFTPIINICIYFVLLLIRL